MTSRYIDVEKLKEELDNFISTSQTYTEYDCGYDDCFTAIQDTLADIPTADVAEVRHGKWLTWEEQFPDRKPTKKNNLGVFCNNCHSHADNMTDYCSHCGAKMDGDTNDEP